MVVWHRVIVAAIEKMSGSLQEQQTYSILPPYFISTKLSVGLLDFLPHNKQVTLNVSASKHLQFCILQSYLNKTLDFHLYYWHDSNTRMLGEIATKYL